MLQYSIYDIFSKQSEKSGSKRKIFSLWILFEMLEEGNLVIRSGKSGTKEKIFSLWILFGMLEAEFLWRKARKVDPKRRFFRYRYFLGRRKRKFFGERREKWIQNQDFSAIDTFWDIGSGISLAKGEKSGSKTKIFSL